MSPMTLDEPAGRYLSLAEREEISRGLAAGKSLRVIARELARAPSTISREIRRHSGVRGNPRQYRAVTAQGRAESASRAAHARLCRIATNPALQEYIQDKLKLRWSPEQISSRLRIDFPDDGLMRASHETIYQALYVQGRGALRRELTTCLRTGRALRKPRRGHKEVPSGGRGRIPDMVTISERPAEAEDRAVPGHWEGDLIMGQHNKSAIGTLVERSTRFVMLMHLPGGHNAENMQAAIAATIGTLPAALRRSLTWDQGTEMKSHRQITIAQDLPIYFCDPHSPWQRGSNENTNGLLRQYYPKGTDLSVHDIENLTAVAAELNERPRKTLGWRTPAQALQALLSDLDDDPVASRP
ncbi:IS30 family transposase [Georgenia subflava]|uniref:IS30 family transposase n=1 Tax=Georgenia subflava TaxID=1622177 RepID=A0A6N7EMB7_9MICO|nr:IS30 family transposase [Georgenia subflava]MPV38223.1 IS30 family transposase [Georgenia subflava]